MDMRLASLKDADAVMALALRFFAASPYHDKTVDISKVETVISTLLSNDDAIVLLLVNKDGKPVGMLAGFLSEMIFSRDKVASEAIWWVDPEYRQSKMSFKMMEAFEWWANKRGCKHTHMSLLADETGDRLSKFYERRGYKARERAFIKELN
jgi:GNAT superfamily N-acetyltransferase